MDLEQEEEEEAVVAVVVAAAAAVVVVEAVGEVVAEGVDREVIDSKETGTVLTREYNARLILQ